MSADGSTFLHCPNGLSTTYYSKDKGATWTASNINVSNAIPVADMVNPNKIYIYNSGSGNFNVSNDGGATFSVTVNIGAGGSKIIRTEPFKEGNIWVAMYGGGLKRSVNSGASFTTIAGVQACSAIGLGKVYSGGILLRNPDATYYFTLYIWGTVNGVTGLFRSIDEGANWIRINDDAHQFGGPGNGQFVMGDMNTYGIVYMSTVGRGVIAGQDQINFPISLASLNVQETEQNGKHTAQLNWKTLSESNASHFNIERSTNALSWVTAGTVNTEAVNGNSTSVLNYNYADDLAGMTGMVYYRLKMTDKDASYTYSNIVSLNIGKSMVGFKVSLLPNPLEAKSGAVVHITSDKAENVMLKVISSNGAVLGIKYAAIAAGNTNINISELVHQPQGLYMLKVISAVTYKNLGGVQFVIR